MPATIAAILGVVLLVTAIGGLAGLWWSLAAAGFALLAFAVLDTRAAQTEPTHRPTREVER
jgi:VIT1/CCC1 family predicted Fe2+/Mn2+ transporter